VETSTSESEAEAPQLLEPSLPSVFSLPWEGFVERLRALGLERSNPSLFESVRQATDPEIQKAIQLKFLLELRDIRPVNDEHFHAYVEALYGVSLPWADVCEGHVSPMRIWSDLFFGRVNDAIIVFSRESGKTLGYAILDHMQMGLDGLDIANVGAIESQALKCYSYIEGFCREPHFKDWLAKPPMLSKTYFKNGGFVEIMPATMGRVNSPHPNIANLDECELTTMVLVNEMASMPIRKKGRPPAIRFTSSRKKAHGPLELLLRESDKRGLTVFTGCVFEVMEQCLPARHQQGEGCKTCPLAEECLPTRTNELGELEQLPGPGKAIKARGWMNIDDIIRQKKLMDRDTWESQWLSLRPSQKGLIYPTFALNRHVVPQAEWPYNPALPVYGMMDFGYTNAGCALFAQLTPTDDFIIFYELYETALITQKWAEKIKRLPWYENITWFVGDPAAADGRATMNDNGVRMSAADNEVDRGIARVRYLLDPPDRDLPMLYVTDNCVNTVYQFQVYHVPAVPNPDSKNPKEEPEKVDDHAMDALRYGVTQMFGNRLKI